MRKTVASVVVLVGCVAGLLPATGNPAAATIASAPAPSDDVEPVPSVPLPDPIVGSDPADRVSTLPAELDDLPDDETSDVVPGESWTAVPGMPVEVRALPEAAGSPQMPPDSASPPDAVTEPANVVVSLERPADIGSTAMLLDLQADLRTPDWPGGDGSELDDPADAASVDPAVFLRTTGLHAAQKSTDESTDPGVEPSGIAVRVSYGDFDNAFGAGWGDRLVIMAYPACFADNPDVAECSTGAPVSAVNNTQQNTLRFTTISASDLADLLADGEGVSRGADSLPDDAPPIDPDVDPGASSTAEPSLRRKSDAPSQAHAISRVAATSLSVDSGVVYAVTAAPGAYGPSPISPAGDWQVGVGSGEFTYSYPFRLPPALGGATPSLGLSYSSASVDGMTSAVNGQSSPAGLGWELDPGFISRSYAGCSDDGQSGKGDLCWKSVNGGVYEQMTLSLNGHASRLVPTDPDHPNRFRLKDDPGWRVERFANSDPAAGDPANADNNNEAFKVTSPDGVVYWFGWGRDNSQSVWTVPVFGNDSGEPCYNSGAVSTRWCMQGWRWNLDKVVDPSGNATRYYYSAEKNYYSRWGDASPGSNRTQYDKGGYLDRIEYGFDRQSGVARQVVELGRKRRCTEQLADPNGNCDGTNGPQQKPQYWPDVPADLICGDTGTCTVGSPSFFTTWRYDSVSTFVVTSASNRLPVEKWTLAYTMPDPDGGAGSDPADLWLNQILRTGLNGGSEAVPGVNFNGVALDNRVAPGGGRHFSKLRISSVRNESGGRVEVQYGHANNASGDMACTPSYVANRSRWASDKECFAVKWVPPTGGDPQWEWFHKYVVSRVAMADDTLGLSSLHQPTTNHEIALGRLRVYDYDYVGTPAWRFVGSPLVDQADESWSDWRGYGVTYVKTRRVDGTGGILGGSILQHRYARYRGMDGAPANMSQVTDPANNPRPQVRIDTTFHSDDASNNPIDNPAFEGLIAEDLELDGDGTRMRRVYTDYDSVKTADSNGAGDQNGGRQAFIRYPTAATTTVWGSGGTGSNRRLNYGVDHSVDALGILAGVVTEVRDTGADFGSSADDTCTKTGFDTDIAGWIRNPNDVQVLTGGSSPCAATGTNLQTREHTVYDSAGRPTQHETYTAPGQPAIVTKTGYDIYGRTAWTEAPAGDSDGVASTVAPPVRTTIDYNPGSANGALLTAIETTTIGVVEHRGAGGSYGDATSTTEYDPAWGYPTKTTDANNSVSMVKYDALGRTLEVRKPGRASGDAPSVRYTYQDNWDKPSRVMTETLRADNTATGGGLVWDKAYQFYDGWGRAIESQVPQPDANNNGLPDDGRVVTVTGYNAQGLQRFNMPLVRNDDTNFNTVVNPDPDAVQRYTITEFDAIGRPTAVIKKSLTATVSTISTQYSGKKTTVTPPVGALTITQADDLGRATSVAIRKRDDTMTFDSAAYSYTPTGQLATASKVIDGHNYTWSYGYDMAGRELWSYDPDTGATVTTYDQASNPIEIAAGPTGPLTDVLDTTNPYAPSFKSSAASDVTRSQTIYDPMSRPVQIKDVTGGGDVTLTSWDYDDPAVSKSIGRLTRVTRPITGVTNTSSNGAGALGEFVSKFTYDHRGRITATEYVFPSWVTDDSAGPTDTSSATTTTSYNQADQPTSTAYPAIAGGLPALTVDASYTTNGHLERISDGSYQIATTTYNHIWQTEAISSGSPGGPGAITKGLTRTYDFDNATGRITDISATNVQVGAAAYNPIALEYSFDDNGNPLKIKSTVRDSATGAVNVGAWCYTYGQVGRLFTARTGADGTGNSCDSPTSGSDAAIGSQNYDLRFDYREDDISRVTSNPIGGAGGTNNTVQVDYAHQRPNPDTGVGPHYMTGLSSTTTPDSTWPTALPTLGSVTYDKQGRMKQWAPTGGTSASYSYNNQGQLTKTEPSPGKTSGWYAYHADGTRMIRQTKPGALSTVTTLYLPDGTEISHTKTPTTWSTKSLRNFATPGGSPLATQQSTTTNSNGTGNPFYTWLLADAQHSVRYTQIHGSGAFARVNYYPFGAPVGGGQPATPGNHGYLDKPVDPTGDIRLDQRNYNPALNQLTAPDPVLASGDPQSFNPYAYARNNPISFADPSGLCLPEICSPTHANDNGGPPSNPPPPSGGGQTESSSSGYDSDCCVSSPSGVAGADGRKSDRGELRLADTYGNTDYSDWGEPGDNDGVPGIPVTVDEREPDGLWFDVVSFLSDRDYIDGAHQAATGDIKGGADTASGGLLSTLTGEGVTTSNRRWGTYGKHSARTATSTAGKAVLRGAAAAFTAPVTIVATGVDYFLNPGPRRVIITSEVPYFNRRTMEWYIPSSIPLDPSGFGPV